jgi:hypothetical protein
LKPEKRSDAITWPGNAGLGRKEGRKAIEIARNLMGRKMPMDDIMGITGLTAEEIKGLRLN